MNLRITGLATRIKDKAGKFNPQKPYAWYGVAKETIKQWNKMFLRAAYWCNVSDQLKALQLAKGTKKALLAEIKKAP